MLSTPKNKTANSWMIDLIFITMSLGLFYALWLGSYSLFIPDEGRYSEVAREMLVTGDFITPRLNGVGFFDKPILYYWLQASAIKIFGLTEAALRFWPALIGVFGCAVVYIAGRNLFSRRTGIISAIILATNFLYFGTSHYANLDLEVAVFISSSLLFFIVGIQKSAPKARMAFLYLAYAFAGFAALTKGLIGIAFPIIIIGTWILLLNQWRILLSMRLFSGMIIFLLIAAPWYVLVQKANPQFFEFFFILQQFSRFLTKASFNNQTPMWFYFPTVLFGFLPWTLFLIQAFNYQIKLIWQNRIKHQSELFLILWIILIFVFFSIPKSKTIGYIAPIFPALALLVGNYLNAYWERFKSIGLYSGTISFLLLCAAAGITMIVSARHIFPIDYRMIPYTLSGGFLLVIAAIATYFLIKSKQFSKVFYCMALTAGLFLLLLVQSAHIINYKSTKPLSDIIKAQIKPDDEVITYFRYYQDLPIYLERRITITADWRSDNIASYDNWQRELWYNMPYQDTSAWLIDEDAFWQRWNGENRIFVLMPPDFYKQFVSAMKINSMQSDPPVPQILGKHANVILISNKNHI